MIYIEEMATTGHTSADFLAAGKISQAWTPVGAKLLERAKARVKFEKVAR